MMTMRAVPTAGKAVLAAPSFRGKAISAAPVRASRKQVNTTCMAVVRHEMYNVGRC